MRLRCLGNFLFLCGAALSQDTAPPPVFETADVRVSKPGTIDGGGFLSSGRAEFLGVTILDLIATAYGVESEMIFGGPSWLDKDRFDITARAAPATPESVLRPMLQALLADRFKLSIHREDKPMPVYALTLGKRGPKLKEAVDGGAPQCKGSGGRGAISYVCQNLTMASLAERLRPMAPGYLDHTVVDMTGLKGAYDFTMSWTARGQLRKGDTDQDSNVMLFDAVDKQLGLKLEAQKQAMSVVVVDRADQKPAGNPSVVTRTTPPAPKEFEVASVRASKPGTNTQNMRFLPSGQLELSGMSLKELIALAWDIEDDMLVGGPKGLDGDRFDIVAKTSSAAPIEAVRLMLQALLAERFKLAVHREEQPMPVYALTVGKRPKLTETSGSSRAGCKVGAADGARTYTCQNTTMVELVGKLRGVAPGFLDHPVVDLTGLKGSYDFVLSWAPKARFATPQADPTGDLTLFEAVDKQLGLKLAAEKYPMSVVVIDHVDRTPTEN